MKLALGNWRVPSRYLHGGLLALAMSFLLVSISVAQNADTRIAFMSTRSGDGEIYLINPDGKRVRRLTKDPEYDSAPAWSPDGKKITFTSFRDLHRPGGVILAELYVMNADGTNPINLTQSPEKLDSVSSWSPDGKQIAFTSAVPLKWNNELRWNIWVMEADGGNPRNLTNHDAEDRSPDWSPDGKQIAFASDRNRDWEFENNVIGNWEVFVMNADGTNLINLTNHLATDDSPDWSPDGKRIAFISNRDENSEVYVMNADGTNPINLTNHPAADSSPTWSPEGLRIAFSTNRDGDWEVYVMNADGTNPINLTNHPAWDSTPSWGSVQPLSVSQKGRLATLWGKVKRAR